MQTSSGLSVAYETRGNGRPVVFLHPVGTRKEFWHPVMDVLGDRYRSVAVDLRGHGGSDTLGRPFGLADLADDIAELMAMQSAGDAVVVGCSMGGMVALGVAAKAPDLLSGIVLAGTSHIQTPQSKEAMAKRAAAALNGMPAAVDTTLDRWFPAAFAEANSDAVARVRSWLLECDPVVFSWAWRAIAELDYSRELPRMSLPALLVRGSEDASVNEERMRAMAELLPMASYVSIEGAGHVAPYEQPEKFCSALTEFIAAEIG